MADSSPPSIPRSWAATIIVLYVLFLLYSILLAAQPLLGLLPALIIIPLYLLWRLLVAIEAIADAQQRIAHKQDQKK